MLTLNILNTNSESTIDDSSVPDKNCCGSCKNSGQCTGKGLLDHHLIHQHDSKNTEIHQNLIEVTNLLESNKKTH